jgi:hypothetical protein
MARDQELKFKPHIGLFFRFCVESPAISKKIYGNEMKRKTVLEPLPDAILVIDEKRNYVRFIHDDGISYWTRKTHIEPVVLPIFEGSPLPTLQKVREFLVYCTHSRIMEFQVETMAHMAVELLPKIDSLIEKYRLKIVPKEDK